MSVTTLPDGFWELTAPWRDAGSAAVGLTLGGLALIVVLAVLAVALGRRASGLSGGAEVLARIMAVAFVVAVLALLVALPVWWTLELGVPFGVTALVGVGGALVAVSGFLAYKLITSENPRARAGGALFGLLALGIVGALVTWWTIGIAVAFQVAVALWDFSGGFAGVMVMGGSVVLIAVLCLLAYRLRDTLGWTSGLFGAMAVLVGLWWLIGIVPSAWVYFVDSQQELLQDRVIPSSIAIGNLDVASDFYNVVRDSFVMIEGAIVLAAGVVLMFAIQKRFPKGLSEGEDRGPTTGGYK